MKKYNIALLPGDGVGPEVVKETERVLRATEESLKGFQLDMQQYEIGCQRYLDHGDGEVLPESTFQDCKAADAILLGAVGIPKAGMDIVRDKGGTEVTGHVMFKLRFDLNLYAGVRPIKSYPNCISALRGKNRKIDLVIVRESVEGLFSSYNGGGIVRDIVAFDTQIITRAGTEKAAKYCFEMALKRNGRVLDGKRMVTCAHKGNVFRSFAFMTKVFGEVAKNYEGRVQADYAMIDALTLWMTQEPERFDVILAENAHGDIISDLAASYVGGMGMAPSGDIGEEHAMFQPAHGSAPTIAGKGIVNPTAAIISGKMMLEWLGNRSHDEAMCKGAKLIDNAVYKTFESGCLTSDVGGKALTREFGNQVISNIRKLAPAI
jgi:3-isopropylmalate dehydrogenase